MRKIKFLVLFISLIMFINLQVFAQNLGIGPDTFDPDASAGVEMQFTDKGLLIPRVTLISTTSTSPITTPIATSLLVYNTATNGDVTPGFYYWNGSKWMRLLAIDDKPAWLLNGNACTTPGTNFIGTTDNADLSFKTNNKENMRLYSTGQLVISDAATIPSAESNTILTVKPTTNNYRNGISIPMSGATSNAYAIKVNSASANSRGYFYENTSGSNDVFYGAGAQLSTTNIVSGYLGYRNSSGLSYGIYGINGTNDSYATNANAWAAFIQGRAIISSESTPTSSLGVDLEIKNTMTGQGNPATLSMRQTTAETVSGSILARLNFGDNYTSNPQAQIQVLRDAASGSSSDMPTSITFSTTSDGSSALTERMRITNNGNVGIGTTSPSAQLHTTSGVRFEGVGSTSSNTQILTRDGSGNLAYRAAGAWAGGSDNVTGSGTATHVAFWSGANTLSSNTNLYWDNTNSRLGIGTSSPSYDLHVQRTGGASSTKIGYSSSYTDNRLFFGDGNYVYVGEYNTDDRLYLRGGSLTIDINGSTGTSGQVLTSNGTTCSWTTPSSSGVTMGCATNNYLTKRSSTTSLSCSNIYDNGTTVQIGSTTLTNSKLGILNSDYIYGLYISSCGTGIYASGTCTGYYGVDGEGYTAGIYGHTTQNDNAYGRLGYYDGNNFYGVHGVGSASTASSAAIFGIISNGSNSQYQAIRGEATGGSGKDNRGVTGLGGPSSGSATTSYGVKGHAQNSTTGYGVYGSASGCTTGYGLYCSGNGAYTGTWTSPSDEKFKKNISDYNNALENIMKLRPVTYEMKTEEYPFMNFEKGTQIGFIAQEIQSIFPNLVVSGAHPGENENDPFIEYKGINYIGLTPILVKAIQEQQIKIDDLKSKYESLQKRLEEIESILESLQ